MNSLILFQQLLVLLALMLTGFIAYKTHLLNDQAQERLSSLIVWILNPFLMISGVIGKNTGITTTFIWQNIVLVSFFYIGLFLLGFIYIFIMRIKGNERYMYRMTVLFPNVGFMGVPLVKEMLGAQYVVLVAFYLVAFNLITYSYGIHLASRYGGNTEKFKFKRLLSPGMVASVTSILIFALNLNVAGPIKSYIDYMGNTSIVISMFIIGVSLARINWKTDFLDKKYLFFLVADMLVFPLILILTAKLLPFEPEVVGVFQVMACMPVASTTCMFAQEYAGDGTECAKLIALTTVATVITAPIVIMLSNM